MKNQLFFIALLFFSSVTFGRNLKIYNPIAHATMEVIFNGKSVTIKPHTATSFTIPNTKIILDVYFIWPTGTEAKVFKITIEKGCEHLVIDQKDFESLSEGLKAQEKVTIEAI